jgi:NitT/TauT family transport system ATP-binding protein
MVTHDVEEALYLSQRIYAFSSRPGRVKREVQAPFGQGRTRAIRRDPVFLDLREDVQSLLLDEAGEG